MTIRDVYFGVQRKREEAEIKNMSRQKTFITVPSGSPSFRGKEGKIVRN